MVSVRWSADALRDLEKIDSIIARRIVAKVIWLGENFSDILPEKLHQNLKGLYKLRVGDYRVVYSLRRDVITILAVGHRRNIYDKL